MSASPIRLQAAGGQTDVDLISHPGVYPLLQAFQSPGIDAETGAHLWAERFDKPVADLFDMQDEIVARLANQLGAQLIAAEARRAERAPHPDSTDLYYQGLAWFNKGVNREFLTQAREFFERALALDPGNVDALIGTGQVDATLGATLSH